MINREQLHDEAITKMGETVKSLKEFSQSLAIINPTVSTTPLLLHLIITSMPTIDIPKLKEFNSELLTLVLNYVEYGQHDFIDKLLSMAELLVGCAVDDDGIN